MQLETISAVFQINSMVTTLRLTNNNIPDEGLVALADCIMARPNITELNVSGNRAGAAGCKALAEVLQSR